MATFFSRFQFYLGRETIKRHCDARWAHLNQHDKVSGREHGYGRGMLLNVLNYQSVANYQFSSRQEQYIPFGIACVSDHNLFNGPVHTVHLWAQVLSPVLPASGFYLSRQKGWSSIINHMTWTYQDTFWDCLKAGQALTYIWSYITAEQLALVLLPNVKGFPSAY